MAGGPKKHSSKHARGKNRHDSSSALDQQPSSSDQPKNPQAWTSAEGYWDPHYQDQSYDGGGFESQGVAGFDGHGLSLATVQYATMGSTHGMYSAAPYPTNQDSGAPNHLSHNGAYARNRITRSQWQQQQDYHGPSLSGAGLQYEDDPQSFGDATLENTMVPQASLLHASGAGQEDGLPDPSQQFSSMTIDNSLAPLGPQDDNSNSAEHGATGMYTAPASPSTAYPVSPSYLDYYYQAQPMPTVYSGGEGTQAEPVDESSSPHDSIDVETGSFTTFDEQIEVGGDGAAARPNERFQGGMAEYQGQSATMTEDGRAVWDSGEPPWPAIDHLHPQTNSFDFMVDDSGSEGGTRS